LNDDIVQYHIKRVDTLKTDRGNFETQWEESALRVIPEHSGSFIGSKTHNLHGGQGANRTQHAYDATAVLANSRFASVLESIATPQNAYWHSLRPADKTLLRHRHIQKYFQDLADALFSARYAPYTGFITNMQQVYMGLGAYGNGCIYVDANPKGGLRYRNVHLGEAYFCSNHSGSVDTVYRVFNMSVKDIVDEFGAERVPAELIEITKNPTQQDTKMEIIHAVYPRKNPDSRRVDAAGFPYASVYILRDKKHLLAEGGYSTFPYPIARYQQAPGEVYGRGPAQLVSPSIKVINQEKKDLLTQSERAVRPVLLSYDDGNLGSFTLRPGRLNAGGLNKDGKRMVDVLPHGNVNIALEMMELEQKVINDAFLITLFQILVETPRMTATEVLERAREKGMLIAPTTARLQADLFGPMIEREIDVLSKQGALPEPPMELMDRDGNVLSYAVEFTSPMARMRDAEKASGFFRALQQALEVVNITQDPSILDHFDFDAAVPGIQFIQGAPVEWTRAMEQVEEIRQGREEKQSQQQAIDAMPAMAGLAKVAQGPKENQIP